MFSSHRAIGSEFKLGLRELHKQVSSWGWRCADVERFREAAGTWKSLQEGQHNILAAAQLHRKFCGSPPSPFDGILSNLTALRRSAHEPFMRKVYSKCLLLARREQVRWRADVRVFTALSAGRRLRRPGASVVPLTLDGCPDQGDWSACITATFTSLLGCSDAVSSKAGMWCSVLRTSGRHWPTSL